MFNMKQDPWFISISSGRPTLLHRRKNSLATTLPVAALKGKASGYLVA